MAHDSHRLTIVERSGGKWVTHEAVGDAMARIQSVGIELSCEDVFAVLNELCVERCWVAFL